jgi:hypothetical protein
MNTTLESDQKKELILSFTRNSHAPDALSLNNGIRFNSDQILQSLNALGVLSPSPSGRSAYNLAFTLLKLDRSGVLQTFIKENLTDLELAYRKYFGGENTIVLDAQFLARIVQLKSSLLSSYDADDDGKADVNDCAPNDINKFQLLTFYSDPEGDGFGTYPTSTLCVGDETPIGYSKVLEPGHCGTFRNGTSESRPAFLFSIVAAGQSCYSYSETQYRRCTDGVMGNWSGSYSNLTCYTRSPQYGDTCTSNSICGSAMTCLHGSCVYKVWDNGECDDTADCALSSQQCFWAGSTYRCKTPNNGAYCTSNTQCSSRYCSGNTCRP